MNERKTQCKRLLEYLAENDGITQLEAIRDLGIYRLPSRVSELKKAGYNITSKFVNVKNRWNEKCHVKRYYLEVDNGRA